MAATVCMGYCCIAMTTESKVGELLWGCCFRYGGLCLTPVNLPTAQAIHVCQNCIAGVSCRLPWLLPASLFDFCLSSNAASSEVQLVLSIEACLSNNAASSGAESMLWSGALTGCAVCCARKQVLTSSASASRRAKLQLEAVPISLQ